MQNKINEKQQKILDFLNEQIEKNGYPPSVREICNAVGFKSTSTVHSYLEKLRKQGLIQKDPSKPRALKVINNKKNSKTDEPKNIYSGKELVEVPIIGKVTAGQPILAVENIEDTFPLPLDFVQNSTVFMLRVQGDSMIEAGIFDNDYIVVKQITQVIAGPLTEDIQPTLPDGGAVPILLHFWIIRWFTTVKYLLMMPTEELLKCMVTSARC